MKIKEIRNELLRLHSEVLKLSKESDTTEKRLRCQIAEPLIHQAIIHLSPVKERRSQTQIVQQAQDVETSIKDLINKSKAAK